MGNTKHIIGQRVRRHRTQQGLSQDQLGKMVGLNRVQICRMELGGGNVTLGNLDKVLDGLGLTIEDMFEGKPGIAGAGGEECADGVAAGEGPLESLGEEGEERHAEGADDVSSC